jgi:hypothetical protein
MRFSLQRFKAPSKSVRPLGRPFPPLLLDNRQRPHPFRCDVTIDVSFRGLIFRLEPLPLARVFDPAWRKWTLLRFTLDGVSASTSKPVSWPSSPYALSIYHCKQWQICRSRVLTCRSPIPSAFWVGKSIRLFDLVDSLSIKHAPKT